MTTTMMVMVELKKGSYGHGGSEIFTDLVGVVVGEIRIFDFDRRNDGTNDAVILSIVPKSALHAQREFAHSGKRRR